MLKNYIKIAFRNLQRHKGYAIINVIGLLLGIACGILIFILISYHLSFENFDKNKDRIYRIVSDYHYDGAIEHQSGVQQPFGKVFRNDYSFNEKVARVVYYLNALISLPGENEVKKFNEEKRGCLCRTRIFRNL